MPHVLKRSSIKSFWENLNSFKKYELIWNYRDVFFDILKQMADIYLVFSQIKYFDQIYVMKFIISDKRYITK